MQDCFDNENVAIGAISHFTIKSLVNLQYPTWNPVGTGATLFWKASELEWTWEWSDFLNPRSVLGFCNYACIECEFSSRKTWSPSICTLVNTVPHSMSQWFCISYNKCRWHLTDLRMQAPIKLSVFQNITWKNPVSELACQPTILLVTQEWIRRFVDGLGHVGECSPCSPSSLTPSLPSADLSPYL